jgi:NAD(P)-dependent dehydrogenase (short-subunit alcohol dehydrogenase family)
VADRWAIILGVSMGSGAAIARAVARDPGLNVFGVHRGHHADAAVALERDLRGADREVVMHVADAGTPEGVDACSNAIAERVGRKRVGLVVHSLSGGSLGSFLPKGAATGFHPKQFEKTFNNMAHSFAYWAQAACAKDLLAPGARILGLTNLLHDSLLDNCGLIAAAKGALQMYVKSLAVELGPLGYRVNLLKFGSLLTPALATVLGPEGTKKLEDVYQLTIPATRMLTPEDLGGVVSYLAREESDWFNGATIDFTGGMTLRLLDVVSRLQTTKEE